MKVTSCFFKAFKAINRRQPTLQPLQLLLPPPCCSCATTPVGAIASFHPYRSITTDLTTIFPMRDPVPESHSVCLVSRASLRFSVLARFLLEISLRHELIDNLFWGMVPGMGNWNRRRQLIPSICIEAGHHCGHQAYFCRNLQKNHVRYTAELSCEGTEEGAFIHQQLCSISQWLPHGTCVNGTFQYSGSPEWAARAT